ERRPRERSGGQREGVALGRAMVRQPQVFLFDEPLSNLDAKLRVQMRAEIAALHQRLGTTMIYVTHDQVEAMTLGERIVIMDAGVVQQADRPLTIYREPANRFVAAFIGSPPMNFLSGEIVSGGALLHAAGRVELGAAVVNI
ncbi:MAG TPA: sugar ABC transporter ATP-binding protein, partial [Lacipirellulaceae bacterium]|nr:sugar ABC transporter ATP-binding protein [Lacipirellulaceae bacterium]